MEVRTAGGISGEEEVARTVMMRGMEERSSALRDWWKPQKRGTKAG